MKDFLQKYGVLVAFGILFLVNAIWQSDVFLKPENLRNLISQNAYIGIIAVGMTLVIIAGGIDLSVGSLLALSAALAVFALNKVLETGQPELLAVLAATAVSIGTAVLLGMVNGALVAYARIAPFVATLIGLVAYRSVCLALAQGGEVRAKPSNVFAEIGNGGIAVPFIKVGGGSDLVITWSILLFIAIALIAGFALNRTRFGRYAIAVGANEKAARYSTVNVEATKFWTYAFLGLCCGLAALTLSSRMNSVASSTMGMYYELDAIAAVVIGGTSLKGGSGRIWGTVVGVLLLGVITNMLVVAGVSEYWKGAVKGAVILAAVLLQRGRQ